MRNPLRTKKESRETVPPGMTRRLGMGKMTSICDTTTISTAIPRIPSKPRTWPNLRVDTGACGMSSGFEWSDFDTDQAPFSPIPEGCAFRLIP
jgi:hypothetical protein